MTILFTAFVSLAVRNLSDKALKKLIYFALAALAATLASFLLIHIIKALVGRMRLRVMNTAGGKAVGGFENFTCRTLFVSFSHISFQYFLLKYKINKQQ